MNGTGGLQVLFVSFTKLPLVLTLFTLLRLPNLI